MSNTPLTPLTDSELPELTVICRAAMALAEVSPGPYGGRYVARTDTLGKPWVENLYFILPDDDPDRWRDDDRFDIIAHVTPKEVLPGRCGRGTDSHSFHFRVVKSGGYGMDLLVRHGRGDERFRLSCPAGESFASMSEEDRYWVCQAMYHAIENAREKSHRDTTARWQQAAAEKRIRTRKMPKRDAVKVWIEPAIG